MSQRRQNSACDQCRNRKVKCNIQPGEDKCQHCVNKNYECTFVAQAETEKKRSVTGRRLVRNSPPAMPIKLPPGYHQFRPPSGSTTTTGGEYASGSGEGEYPPPLPPSIPSNGSGSSMNGNGMGYSMDSGLPPLQAGSSNSSSQSLSAVLGGPMSMAPPSPLSAGGSGPIPSAWPPTRAASQMLQERTRTGFIPQFIGGPQYNYSSRSPSGTGYGNGNAGGGYPYPGVPPPPNAPIQDFLAYLFTPDMSPGAETGMTKGYREARRQLLKPEFQIELATELLEVYFQVYHPRVPVVNPTRFRAQLREALYGPSRSERSGSNPLLDPPSKRMRTTDDFLTGMNGNGLSATSSFDSTTSTLSAHSLPSSSSSPSTSPPLKPIHRPLLACLIAWGSKFSDHTLLVADRSQGWPVNNNPEEVLPSRISRMLVDRAREVAEQEKVFRIAKPENVVVCLLMEPVQPLQSYPASDPNGLKCLWLNAGIRHLIEMGVNHNPSGPIPAGQHTGDPDDWACMVFCWWIACVSDALCSLYFKKKPSLSEDDYDLKEFKLVTEKPSLPFAAEGGETDLEKEKVAQQEHAFMLWYLSAHDLAVCSRNLARTLWTPQVMKWGIPLEVINSHRTALTHWREDHLSLVGANNDLQNIGDYVAAVTACTIDCSYHVMWLALSEAIQEYGIREVNEAVDEARVPDRLGSADPLMNGMIPPAKIPAKVGHMIDIELVVANEALNAATRISGLSNVLATNGYMRLDPNAMHWPIYSAGRLLARLGRDEVINCTDGLEQNGFAYEESWKHAKELKDLYQSTLTHGMRDAEALIHPYLTLPARGSRPPPLNSTYRHHTVHEMYKQNVDASFPPEEELKHKHSAGRL